MGKLHPVLEALAFKLGDPDAADAVSAFLCICPTDHRMPLAIDTITRLIDFIDENGTCMRDGASPERFKAAVLARLSIHPH